MPHLFLTSVLM